MYFTVHGTKARKTSTKYTTPKEKRMAMKHIKTVTIAASLALIAITPAIVHSEDFDPDVFLRESDVWLRERDAAAAAKAIVEAAKAERATADPAAERQFARCAIKVGEEIKVSVQYLIEAWDQTMDPVLQIKMYDCMHDAGYDVTSTKCTAYQPKKGPLATPQCYSRVKP
jgi:hypothetical protein